MYVIYCNSGKEMSVVRQLAEKNIRAYAPRRLVMERHFGRWVRREIFLFSGYAFLDEELTPDTWQAVKACYTVSLRAQTADRPSAERTQRRSSPGR